MPRRRPTAAEIAADTERLFRELPAELAEALRDVMEHNRRPLPRREVVLSAAPELPRGLLN